MNTYKKYCPNVFLAKCTEKHNKGDKIILTTKYGKENESIVFNLILEKDGLFYYSIIRADGFNFQEHAKRKAEKLKTYAGNAEDKSDSYYQASNEGKDFLSLAEPIKVGHHSENRHRALIQRNTDRMDKSMEFQNKANEYKDKISYWENKQNQTNLSMPESVEFYEYKLNLAKAKHQGLKNGKIQREHSFSLTYAKKEVNKMNENLRKAKLLWN